MKEKGIKILFSIFLFASILMPFSVYADTTVPVTYNSQSTQAQWQSHLTVTNYCESPLQGSTPCKLTFTLDDNYYGMISFDGYAGTSLALSYVTVFVAGGVGEYNYRTFSNANPMYINSINIMGVGLHLPDSNVDLTDIIDLLTAIETDTTSLDSTTDSILIQLQSLINQAIISNGYLETLNELRLWNIPIESFNFITNFYYKNFDLLDYSVYNNYPIFVVPDNSYIYQAFQYAGTYTMIFLISDNITANTREEWITINNLTFSQIQKQTLFGVATQVEGKNAYFLKLTYTLNNAQNSNIKLINTYHPGEPYYVLPIYFGRSDNKQISTDFALNWGLTNNLLDNLQVIANGTAQSNSAASGLDQNTNQMQSDFNSYYSIENTANSDFNSALNGINFNDQIAGNQSFLDSASFVKTVFSSMMQIPILSTFVIILCIILMARIFL